MQGEGKGRRRRKKEKRETEKEHEKTGWRGNKAEEECSLFDPKKAHRPYMPNINTINNHVLLNHTTCK